MKQLNLYIYIYINIISLLDFQGHSSFGIQNIEVPSFSSCIAEAEVQLGVALAGPFMAK